MMGSTSQGGLWGRPAGQPTVAKGRRKGWKRAARLTKRLREIEKRRSETARGRQVDDDLLDAEGVQHRLEA